jgi:hypothetical protein
MKSFTRTFFGSWFSCHQVIYGIIKKFSPNKLGLNHTSQILALNRAWLANPLRANGNNQTKHAWVYVLQNTGKIHSAGHSLHLRNFSSCPNDAFRVIVYY